jgi:NAD(P)-dependent dehydrogenase (short-subunit alcohol dehydrogenase family)
LDVAASSSEEEEGEMDLEEDLEEVEMERVVREAVGVWGGIDVLVNCAGMLDFIFLSQRGVGGWGFVDVFGEVLGLWKGPLGTHVIFPC